jgi:hypothetical protein
MEASAGRLTVHLFLKNVLPLLGVCEKINKEESWAGWNSRSASTGIGTVVARFQRLVNSLDILLDALLHP